MSNELNYLLSRAAKGLMSRREFVGRAGGFGRFCGFGLDPARVSGPRRRAEKGRPAARRDAGR